MLRLEVLGARKTFKRSAGRQILDAFDPAQGSRVNVQGVRKSGV